MSDKIIVTIGRQFGSGGHAIGKLVAEQLGLAFYDKELLKASAEVSGLDPALFERNDETPVSSLLYSLSTSPLAPGHILGGAAPIAQQVYLAQFDAMRRIAQQEDCLFVGRCADYVLRCFPSLLSVYIHAPLDVRVQRIQERLGVSEKEAKSQIHKIDKRRGSFYAAYADHPWGLLTAYHLTVDSSVLSMEDTADLIVQMAKKRSVSPCTTV